MILVGSDRLAGMNPSKDPEPNGWKLKLEAGVCIEIYEPVSNIAARDLLNQLEQLLRTNTTPVVLRVLRGRGNDRGANSVSNMSPVYVAGPGSPLDARNEREHDSAGSSVPAQGRQSASAQRGRPAGFQHKLNTWPRKILGWKTPLKVFHLTP
jgi:hypothetical protein